MYTNYTKPSTLMTYVGYILLIRFSRVYEAKVLPLTIYIYLSEWNPLAT